MNPAASRHPCVHRPGPRHCGSRPGSCSLPARASAPRVSFSPRSSQGGPRRTAVSCRPPHSRPRPLSHSSLHTGLGPLLREAPAGFGLGRPSAHPSPPLGLWSISVAPRESHRPPVPLVLPALLAAVSVTPSPAEACTAYSPCALRLLFAVRPSPSGGDVGPVIRDLGSVCCRVPSTWNGAQHTVGGSQTGTGQTFRRQGWFRRQVCD